MKQKIKQYFYDMYELGHSKCPNDYPFWYFILLSFPLEIISFLFISFMFFSSIGRDLICR